jgi:phytoene synthase
MTHRTVYRIFKKGSRTYFYNSIFFPKEIKEDVFVLYSFVRKADNMVDSKPQKVQEFYEMKENYKRARAGERTGDIVVDYFSDLVDKKGFEEEWVDSFLKSMEMDLTRQKYRDFDELDEYIYGSAEVIGLFMARTLGLKDEALPHARYLGKAMQYVNFIRDIPEDLTFGRQYIPMDQLEQRGLQSLDYDEVMMNKGGFIDLIRSQVDVYNGWQEYAEEGYKYVPRRLLIPIKNASEMYKWTGKVISKNPMVVFKKKVKPSVPRIVLKIGYNTLTT